MEINSFLATHLQAHYKKVLILCTATATIYLIKKYMDKRRRSKTKKEKKKIKDFPTIEEIQKFIEDLPFDAVTSGKSVTLKDLLGELSEFSEDEDWKELIASVRCMYQDHGTANKEHMEDTGSVMSIYEDPNIISLNGPTPREEDVNNDKSVNVEAVEELASEDKGRGDVEVTNATQISEIREEPDLAAAAKDLGQGDKQEPV